MLNHTGTNEYLVFQLKSNIKTKSYFYPLNLSTQVKTYYVYILKCSDNSYYTGVTNNIDRRLEEHINGINPNAYTYIRRPVELVFCKEFKDIKLAISFEKQIKSWSRKKKEAMIEGRWEDLPELAKCRNSTSHLNFKPGFDSA